jgi:transcriptional regulator with XRE-family HTH domain
VGSTTAIERSSSAAMLDQGAPERRVSTGVPTLDHVLGGLYWGDNVVWQLDGAVAEPFYRAILGLEHAFDARSWIAVSGEPSELVADFPQLEIVGTAPGCVSVEPGDLLRELRMRCDASKRNLLLFESLDGMVHAWGAELTRGFFARCCPLLLDVGAIAYWSMDLREMPATIQDTVEAVTQCVLRLDKHSVRVAKAEGRDQSVRGSLLHWHSEKEGPVLSEAEVIGRVAASLRALRRSRKITQQQLAQMAGVTPSAISQAERAERGLSLSTLVHLSSKLGLTLDDLLHGEDPSTYRIGRRVGDPRRGPERAITLLGGATSDVRIDLVHLGAREAGAPIERQDGEGIVAVSRGLVQVRVGDQTPAIRDGEVLLAPCSRVNGWRNLGDREAVLFWIAIAQHS